MPTGLARGLKAHGTSPAKTKNTAAIQPSRSPPAFPGQPCRRWVIERTFAWLNRNRLAKDFEASIASAKAWLIIASVRLLTRRVAYCECNHADS
jgi:transposase